MYFLLNSDCTKTGFNVISLIAGKKIALLPGDQMVHLRALQRDTSQCGSAVRRGPRGLPTGQGNLVLPGQSCTAEDARTWQALQQAPQGPRADRAFAVGEMPPRAKSEPALCLGCLRHCPAGAQAMPSSAQRTAIEQGDPAPPRRRGLQPARQCNRWGRQTMTHGEIPISTENIVQEDRCQPGMRAELHAEGPSSPLLL